MTEVIKKVKIDRKTISEVNELNQVLVRYRIIFDNIKYSAYSILHAINNIPVKIDTTATALLSGSRIQINWSNINNFSTYDIYVKYANESSYVYLDRVSSLAYSFVVPNGKTASKVWVQLACSNKTTPTAKVKVAEITVA
jgi:hypothetical protein